MDPSLQYQRPAHPYGPPSQSNSGLASSPSLLGPASNQRLSNAGQFFHPSTPLSHHLPLHSLPSHLALYPLNYSANSSSLQHQQQLQLKQEPIYSHSSSSLSSPPSLASISISALPPPNSSSSSSLITSPDMSQWKANASPAVPLHPSPSLSSSAPSSATPSASSMPFLSPLPSLSSSSSSSPAQPSHHQRNPSLMYHSSSSSSSSAAATAAAALGQQPLLTTIWEVHSSKGDMRPRPELDGAGLLFKRPHVLRPLGRLYLPHGWMPQSVTVLVKLIRADTGEEVSGQKGSKACPAVSRRGIVNPAAWPVPGVDHSLPEYVQVSPTEGYWEIQMDQVYLHASSGNAGLRFRLQFITRAQLVPPGGKVIAPPIIAVAPPSAAPAGSSSSSSSKGKKKSEAAATAAPVAALSSELGDAIETEHVFMTEKVAILSKPPLGESSFSSSSSAFASSSSSSSSAPLLSSALSAALQHQAEASVTPGASSLPSSAAAALPPNIGNKRARKAAIAVESYKEPEDNEPSSPPSSISSASSSSSSSGGGSGSGSSGRHHHHHHHHHHTIPHSQQQQQHQQEPQSAADNSSIAMTNGILDNNRRSLLANQAERIRLLEMEIGYLKAQKGIINGELCNSCQQRSQVRQRDMDDVFVRQLQMEVATSLASVRHQHMPMDIQPMQQPGPSKMDPPPDAQIVALLHGLSSQSSAPASSHRPTQKKGRRRRRYKDESEDEDDDDDDDEDDDE